MEARPDQPSAVPPLVISRVFAAPKKRVFLAWSTADHIKRWFAPSAFTIPEATVDFRVGGVFELCMRAPNGTDFWSKGHFLEVSPFDRLVVQFAAIGQDQQPIFDAHTVVTFADEGSHSTLMQVTQTYTIHNPAAPQFIKGAPEGWKQTLDRLAVEIARIQA